MRGEGVGGTLRVGSNFYVSASEVVLVQGFPSRPSRREKARAEAANCYYEAMLSDGKRGRTRSLVTLKSGWVVASPSRPETLVRRLSHAPTAAFNLLSAFDLLSAHADPPDAHASGVAPTEPSHDGPTTQPEPQQQQNPPEGALLRRGRNLFRRR